MRSGVVVVDLSVSMPLRGVFERGRDAAVAVTAYLERSSRHRLAGVVGTSSRARTLSVAELPGLDWDFDYGVDLHGAFELASSLLVGSDGRVVLISAVEFNHRRRDGTYTANRDAASQAAGRDTIARWLDAELAVDLLWCVGAPWPTGRHEQTIRSLIRGHGGFVAQVDGDTPVVDTYLYTVWG